MLCHSLAWHQQQNQKCCTQGELNGIRKIPHTPVCCSQDPEWWWRQKQNTYGLCQGVGDSVPFTTLLLASSQGTKQLCISLGHLTSVLNTPSKWIWNFRSVLEGLQWEHLLWLEFHSLDLRSSGDQDSYLRCILSSQDYPFLNQTHKFCPLGSV